MARLQTVLLRKFEYVDLARRWHRNMQRDGKYASDSVACASYEGQLAQLSWEIDGLGFAIEEEKRGNSRRDAPRFWDLQVALERAIAYFEKRGRAYGYGRYDTKAGDAEAKAVADGVAYQARFLLEELKRAISEDRRLPRGKKALLQPIELKAAAEVEKKIGGTEKPLDI